MMVFDKSNQSTISFKRSPSYEQNYEEYLKIMSDYYKVIDEQSKIFRYMNRIDNRLETNQGHLQDTQFKTDRFLDPVRAKMTDEQYKKYQKEQQKINQEAQQRLDEREKKFQIFEEQKQKYLKMLEDKREQMKDLGQKLPPALPKKKAEPKQKPKQSFFFMGKSAPTRKPRGPLPDPKLEFENHCQKCQNKIKEKRNKKIQFKEILLGKKINDEKLDYIMKNQEFFSDLEDVEKVEDEQDLLQCGCVCARCNPKATAFELRNKRLEKTLSKRAASMPKYMMFKTVRGGSQPFVKIDMEQLRAQQEKFIRKRDPSNRHVDSGVWRF